MNRHYTQYIQWFYIQQNCVVLCVFIIAIWTIPRSIQFSVFWITFSVQSSEMFALSFWFYFPIMLAPHSIAIDWFLSHRFVIDFDFEWRQRDTEWENEGERERIYRWEFPIQSHLSSFIFVPSMVLYLHRSILPFASILIPTQPPTHKLSCLFPPHITDCSKWICSLCREIWKSNLINIVIEADNIDREKTNSHMHWHLTDCLDVIFSWYWKWDKLLWMCNAWCPAIFRNKNKFRQMKYGENKCRMSNMRTNWVICCLRNLCNLIFSVFCSTQ